MKIVIKVGGSLCINERGPDLSYFSRLLPVLKAIKRKNQLIVAVGGGRLVRNYFSSVAGFDLSDVQKEWLAIDLLKANARFFSFVLGTSPIFSIKDIKKSTEGVISGIVPGRSTDANAAIAASLISADLFVKMTDVNGLYDKDPKRYKSAVFIPSMGFERLRKFSKKGGPGCYGILDPIAVETIADNRIRTVIMPGEKPELLLDLLKGKKIGTLVS